jgi:hypothetical protein
MASLRAASSSSSPSPSSPGPSSTLHTARHRQQPIPKMHVHILFWVDSQRLKYSSTFLALACIEGLHVVHEHLYGRRMPTSPALTLTLCLALHAPSLGPAARAPP